MVPTADIPDLVAAVNRLARGSVTVIGDAMLDRYIYGTMRRVSPEAPVAVMVEEREVATPGGAGNVVRNLTALGAAVAFVSVVGDDQAGSDLTSLIGGQPGVEPWLLVQGGRTTTVKTRYIADGQQLLRAGRVSGLGLRQQPDVHAVTPTRSPCPAPSTARTRDSPELPGSHTTPSGRSANATGSVIAPRSVRTVAGAPSVSPRRSAVALVISVWMNPGAMAFAVTPNLPSSMARVLVRPCMPAFAAE